MAPHNKESSSPKYQQCQCWEILFLLLIYLLRYISQFWHNHRYYFVYKKKINLGQQVPEQDMQILQQHRNTALSFNIQAAQSYSKPTDISKLITGHFIALQREEIQLHLPEHWHKLPWPGNLDKPPTVRNLHNRGTTNCQNIERPPQTQQSK